MRVGLPKLIEAVHTSARARRLTKDTLGRWVPSQLTQKDVRAVLDALGDALSQLAPGDTVTIPGLGAFRVMVDAPKRVRAWDGTVVIVTGKRSLRFRETRA